jgi:hypothetical protein
MTESRKRGTGGTAPDLDNVINSLDVKFVELAECLVSSGYRPGPLWGRAVDSLDMRECIGWLSGDG